MHGIAFHKYEGLGNDFVLVEAPDQLGWQERAKVLCDRRFGIGADGVLVVLPAASGAAHASMVVVNADGSIPEMCGNGLRCAALHVARARGIAEGELVFDTGAGLRACVIDDRDARGVVTIDMGIVRVSAEDVAIDVDGDLWTFAVADAGNPHAVTMRRADRAQMEWVGRRVATHAHFPTGTNVEFARYGEHDVDLVVYERGVGITMACGTGACATVAVGVARGHLAASEEVRVRLPGGSLYVSVTEGGRVTMRGPARHVFSGEAAQ